MHCRNCNTQLANQAIACTSCGMNPNTGSNFCANCGAPTVLGQVACTSCGAGLAPSGMAMTDLGNKKLVAGLCAIFIGGFGIHKFILGYQKAGIITICCSFLTCGIGYPVMHVLGIIEGIIYLTKSDADFYQTYIAQQKEWL